MKEFSCGDVVPGCSASFSASSDEELLHHVAGHARDAHGIAEVSKELVEAVMKHVRVADHG